MKRVVLQPPPPIDVVDVSNVNSDKFYGALVGADNKCAVVITNEEYNSNRYRARLIHVGFTRGNSYHYAGGSFRELIKLILADGKEVFEFNNLLELAQWADKYK